MLLGMSHRMPVGFGANSGAKPSLDARPTDHYGVLTPLGPWCPVPMPGVCPADV